MVIAVENWSLFGHWKSPKSLFRCAVFFFWAISLVSCKNKPTQSNAAAHDGATIWIAAEKGDLQQVDRILQQGTPIDVKDGTGSTALHYAAQSKNLQLVEFLIDHGADVNAKAKGNVTPLWLSLDMAFGQPDISLELIRAGADVSAADSNVGDAPILIAATESSYEVMEELLKRGANPNAQNVYGETALHYAAMNGLNERVQLLLQYGANPMLRDKSGKSSIDVAQTTNPEHAVQKNFAKTRILLLAASRHEH